MVLTHTWHTVCGGQWVTIWMALGFLAANQNQPGYDSYYNICYLRDTNMRSGACELPASFDKDRYLVDAENEHPFTETIEENFENPPDCVLNYATTMCVKPNCAFRVSLCTRKPSRQKLVSRRAATVSVD